MFQIFCFKSLFTNFFNIYKVAVLLNITSYCLFLPKKLKHCCASGKLWHTNCSTSSRMNTILPCLRCTMHPFSSRYVWFLCLLWPYAWPAPTPKFCINLFINFFFLGGWVCPASRDSVKRFLPPFFPWWYAWVPYSYTEVVSQIVSI